MNRETHQHENISPFEGYNLVEVYQPVTPLPSTVIFSLGYCQYIGLMNLETGKPTHYFSLRCPSVHPWVEYRAN